LRRLRTLAALSDKTKWETSREKRKARKWIGRERRFGRRRQLGDENSILNVSG
jgi:hypothetical protein